jgi:hypothetical protein
MPAPPLESEPAMVKAMGTLILQVSLPMLRCRVGFDKHDLSRFRLSDLRR